MRRALPLLLLLAACEPRRNPRNIERALSTSPIDAETLEDLLGIGEGTLRLMAPHVNSIRTSPPTDGWYLENVGKRPVWIRREDLRVQVFFRSFLGESSPRRYGCRRRVVARPTFVPEEWFLFERGMRVPLALDSPIQEPGEYTLRIRLYDRGQHLGFEARAFNSRAVAPRSLLVPLLDSQVGFLLLPPFDWPGAPWHDSDAIEPVSLGNGRFQLSPPVVAGFVETPALEAFVLSEQGDRYQQTLLEIERGESLPTYRLPARLERGEYRLLVRATDEDLDFSLGPHRCPGERGAASRWIPFRVE